MQQLNTTQIPLTLEEKIKNLGYVIITDIENRLAYTIGLSNQGYQDLVIVGNSDTSETILNNAMNYMKDNQTNFKHNETVSALYPYRVKAIKADITLTNQCELAYKYNPKSKFTQLIIE